MSSKVGWSGGWAKNIIVARDPQGSFATQALLCTDPAADPTRDYLQFDGGVHPNLDLDPRI